MPHPLGDTELDTLQEFVDTGDRVGYYGQLEDWGYKYGELARGVVTGDQLSGRTANNFFQDRAEDQLNAYNEENGFTPNDAGYASPDLSKTDMAELSQALMQADFEARNAYDSPNRNGERLSVTTVQDYHAEAFQEQFDDRMPGGVTIEAWTPYEALQKRDTVEGREELWDNMLEQPAAITSLRTVRFNGYGGDQVENGFKALGGVEGNVGPYVIDNPNEDGKIIAGTSGHDGTVENPFHGTTSDDVIYTFTGHDVINADSGNDMMYSGGGNKVFDGGTGTDFVNYRPENGIASSDIASMNTSIGGPSLAYTSAINRQDIEINVVDDQTMMSIEKTGLETHMFSFQISEVRSTDTTHNVEGYLGSDVTDVVNLNGTTHDLYLDGGNDEDTFRARLPEGVEADAIFDNSSGLIPENHEFGNLPYDSRLMLENGETVYIINFENVDVGRVEEGIIVQANTENGALPDISITNPDVLDSATDADLETALPSGVSLEAAVDMLSKDAEVLNNIANPTDWQSTVRDAVNHPDAAQMYQNLHAGGVETVPAHITPDMDAETRTPELLTAVVWVNRLTPTDIITLTCLSFFNPVINHFI